VSEELQQNKFCKYCGGVSQKSIRNGIDFFRGICTDCLTKKRRNIPLDLKKETIGKWYLVENKTIQQICDILNIKYSHCLWLLKYFNIKEKIVCKYCGTDKNLRKNTYTEKKTGIKKQLTQKICQECYVKIKSNIQKEVMGNMTEEALFQRNEKYKQNYINDPYKKKKETEKANRTKKENPDTAQKAVEKARQTRNNWTNEQRNKRVSLFLQTMLLKTEDEKNSRLLKMGRGVKEAANNRTPEEKRIAFRKYQETCLEKWGVPYNPKCIEGMNRNFKLKKEDIIRKGFETKVKNNSITSFNFSKKGSILFYDLDISTKSYYSYEYNLINASYIFIKKEKAIFLHKKALSNSKTRFLDFYFVNKDNEKICFEFDEYAHNKRRNVCNDILREVEIRSIFPDIKIFRIKEVYYDFNYDVMFMDMIGLIYNSSAKVELDYTCLTDRIVNSFYNRDLYYFLYIKKVEFYLYFSFYINLNVLLIKDSAK